MPESLIKRADQILKIYENTESLTKISRQFDTVFEKLKDRESIVYIDADGTIEEVSARLYDAYEKYIGE